MQYWTKIFILFIRLIVDYRYAKENRLFMGSRTFIFNCIYDMSMLRIAKICLIKKKKASL